WFSKVYNMSCYTLPNLRNLVVCGNFKEPITFSSMTKLEIVDLKHFIFNDVNKKNRILTELINLPNLKQLFMYTNPSLKNRIEPDEKQVFIDKHIEVLGEFPNLLDA